VAPNAVDVHRRRLFSCSRSSVRRLRTIYSLQSFRISTIITTNRFSFRKPCTYNDDGGKAKECGACSAYIRALARVTHAPHVRIGIEINSILILGYYNSLFGILTVFRRAGLFLLKSPSSLVNWHCYSSSVVSVSASLTVIVIIIFYTCLTRLSRRVSCRHVFSYIYIRMCAICTSQRP